MEKSRVTADRVRPILQAMERSIESARRRRLHGSQPQSPSQPLPPSQPQSQRAPAAYQPPQPPQEPIRRDYGQPPHQPPHQQAPSFPREGGSNDADLYDESVPRQKARPKRPSPMMKSYDDPDYRAQAS